MISLAVSDEYRVVFEGRMMVVYEILGWRVCFVILFPWLLGAIVLCF